jgi:hypothetical protein
VASEIVNLPTDVRDVAAVEALLEGSVECIL